MTSIAWKNIPLQYDSADMQRMNDIRFNKSLSLIYKGLFGENKVHIYKR